MNEFCLACRFPVSLRYTVSSHGWVNLEPWEWNESRQELSRPERIDSARSAVISVKQGGPQRILVTLAGADLAQHEMAFAERTVRRWLCTDWDPRPAIRIAASLDPDVAGFIKSGGGRFLRCSTFYEDYVKTVCTVHARWASTKRMVSSLVNGLSDGTFPTPVQVLECGEECLRKDVRLGFRSRVLAESSRRMLDDGTIDERGDLVRDTISFEDLLRLRGVGEYTANHVMMLLGDFSRIPVDSEVTRFCRTRHSIEPKDVNTFFDRWGKYRFLGYKISRALSDGAK